MKRTRIALRIADLKANDYLAAKSDRMRARKNQTKSYCVHTDLNQLAKEERLDMSKYPVRVCP